MTHLAQDFSVAVHGISELSNATVKVADTDTLTDIQESIAVSSSVLYDVMTKEASTTIEGPAALHSKVTAYVSKLAAALDKPAVPAEMLHKIAAVVVADTAIEETREEVKEAEEASEKMASVQSYGREFFVTLLNEVI